MVVNVTVYDLVNYPGTSKTVSVDLKQVVPLGADGDERWVITAYTSATASGTASIQDVFVDDIVTGYSKSTGVNNGPYTVSASQRNMKVSIDGSTPREISLSTSASAIAGSSVASDMENQIKALAVTGGDEAANLSFSNADVSFADGKFRIRSGTSSSSYTGSNKSSVRVTAGATNDVYSHLGFLGAVESEDLAGQTVSETFVNHAYAVASGTQLNVADSTVATAGSDCIGITDGTNTEYRFVSAAPAGQITMNSALSNSYAINSRVQVLRMQDPSATPPPEFSSVDAASRFAIATIVGQIDFSS